MAEAPSSSYRTSGVQINGLCDQGSPAANGTQIAATVVDPSALPAVHVDRLQPGGPPGATAAFTVTGGPFNGLTGTPSGDMAHQYQLTLGGADLTAPQTFYSFCTDLFHANPACYSTHASLTPAPPGLTANLGRIGYLYNHPNSGTCRGDRGGRSDHHRQDGRCS